MWSIPYKIATKAAILCILQLLAVTQHVYGVETRLTDDIEGLFSDKPVIGQAWVGNTYVRLHIYTLSMKRASVCMIIYMRFESLYFIVYTYSDRTSFTRYIVNPNDR